MEALWEKTVLIGTAGCADAELDARLRPAVEHLKDAQPVAIPTETVYGLAANALDPSACARIFSVKRRPSDNPLIAHVSSLEMLRMLVRPAPSPPPLQIDALDELDVPEALKLVLRRLWPGPLTVLLPRAAGVSDVVTAGLGTVAVRFPSHPIAQRIIDLCGFPLAAPSANLSGRPSPTTAQHVLDDLVQRIGFVVDGGPCMLGLESTVLDATRPNAPPLILRPGSITARALSDYLPDVRVFRKTAQNAHTEDVRAMEERPSTPGMKYRHYAPISPLFLFHQPEDKGEGEGDVAEFIREQLAAGRSVARLTTKSGPVQFASEHYREFPLSGAGEHVEIARNLFATLRAADATQPDLIVAESVTEGGEDEGLAIMNRLQKAASVERGRNKQQ